MKKILLLEDDIVLSKEIKTYLNHNSYVCDCLFDGSFVESQILLKDYDCILLDINVPGLNGIEVCRNIRKTNNQVPVLMLTAFGELKDKVAAFNQGADDYLVKPFHCDELMVRLKALLRRKTIPQNNSDLITIADLIINIDEYSVTIDGVEINLSPKEFKLLTILAKANGRVLSKNQIADELWDYHIETTQNTIEVYINFLRKKIDKDNQKKLIHTKVGFGYCLKEL